MSDALFPAFFGPGHPKAREICVYNFFGSFQSSTGFSTLSTEFSTFCVGVSTFVYPCVYSIYAGPGVRHFPTFQQINRRISQLYRVFNRINNFQQTLRQQKQHSKNGCLTGRRSCGKVLERLLKETVLKSIENQGLLRP